MSTTIADREAFWSAVDAALDAREDPLDSEDVQLWLADHPEELEKLCALQRALDVVARPPRKRARKPVLVALGVVAIAACAWLFMRPRGAPAQSAKPDSFVFDYRIRVVTESRGVRASTLLENGTFTRELEHSTPPADAHVASLKITALTEERKRP